MPGCGNLGDDLISVLLIQKIVSSFNPSEVGVLCCEAIDREKYVKLSDKVLFFFRPKKRSIKKYFGRLARINAFIKDSDLIVIGGGGLFQDAHSSFTIHNYLRFLKNAKAKLMILGIGIGPINSKFNEMYLRHFLNEKDIVIQVRDHDSYVKLKELGINQAISVNSDVVEGTNFKTILNELNLVGLVKSNSNVLGCNIRKWADIELNEAVTYILNVMEKEMFNEVSFFVFENEKNIGNVEEKELSERIIFEIQKNKKMKTNLFVYNETADDVFFLNFFNVKKAIASRYHANILWQKAGIPVIPIGYSQKVFSFYSKYGLVSRGFKELCEHKEYEFLQIKKHVFHDYDIPEIPSRKFLCDFKKKYFIYLFEVIGFFGTSFNSVAMRVLYEKK